MKKEVKEKIEYLKGTKKPYLIVVRDNEIVNVDDYLPLIFGNLYNGLYNNSFNKGLSRIKEKCNYTDLMEFEETFPNTPELKYIYINIPCNMNQLDGYKMIDKIIERTLNGGGF